MAGQMERDVGAVIPVSGPLARACSRLSPDVWDRLAHFASATPARSLQRILAFPDDKFDDHKDCPFDADFRRTLLRDSRLPWPCFTLILKLAVSNQLRDGQALRDAAYDVSGFPKLLGFLQTRFLD